MYITVFCGYHIETADHEKDAEAAMEKVNLMKIYQDLFTAGQHKFTLTAVPHLQYITAGGEDNPHESQDSSSSIIMIKAVSEKIRNIVRLELGKDCAQPPLEVIWHGSPSKKNPRPWTYMMLQPSWVTRELFERASHALNREGRKLPKEISFTVMKGGTYVQTLHIGPYEDILPVVDFLRKRWASEHQMKAGQHHHEIYLNTLGSAHSRKLQTIIRLEVSKL